MVKKQKTGKKTDKKPSEKLLFQPLRSEFGLDHIRPGLSTYRYRRPSTYPQFTLPYVSFGGVWIGSALATLSTLTAKRRGCLSYIFPPTPTQQISESNSPIFSNSTQFEYLHLHNVWTEKVFKGNANWKSKKWKLVLQASLVFLGLVEFAQFKYDVIPKQHCFGGVNCKR